MSNFVQLYKSTDTNMPPLCGTVGQLPLLLNAILVDGPGFTGVAITSITRAAAVATATVSAADAKRLRNNMLITISGVTAGADGTLYNITARITYAPGATTFTYTMAGTPSGSATGSPVMAATQPVATITKSGAIALGTLSFADGTLVTGHVCVIAGCTGGDAATYNITTPIRVASAWAVLTAYVLGSLVVNDSGKTFICRTAGTSAASGGPTGTGTAISDGSCSWDYVGAVGTSTQYFSYTMGSTPGSNAAGSPTLARAPLGWAKAFAAGTNSQAYRSADTSSNRFYLQVIDNGATAGGAKEAQIYGAEVMSADNTVTSGRFPTTAQMANGMCSRKSNSADTTVMEWTLWGDDRTFYFSATTPDASLNHAFAFGHFISVKPGDGFNTFITGDITFNTSIASSGLAPYTAFGASLSTSVMYVARLYSQLGGSVAGSLVGWGPNGISGINGSTMTYPNPADSGFYLSQFLYSDANYCIRGRLPGLWQPLHSSALLQYDQVPNPVGCAAGTVMTNLGVGNSGGPAWVLADTFGPWN